MREGADPRGKEKISDVAVPVPGSVAANANGFLALAELHLRDATRQLSEQQILDALKAQGIGDLPSLARETVKHLGAIGGRAALEPWEVFCGNSFVFRRGPIPTLDAERLQQFNQRVDELTRITAIGR